eukprot:TRINITY_DN2052_c0_g1_i1.p4 TRINITY_DN2052_c0_g1~~TRINITY_DN2052_c0_g1_i1.p4  ORF type:complete len:560 (+),score=87.61 TRINITY_DN2052_c0_g1_i1:7838-9517(+)
MQSLAIYWSTVFQWVLQVQIYRSTQQPMTSICILLIMNDVNTNQQLGATRSSIIQYIQAGSKRNHIMKGILILLVILGAACAAPTVHVELTADAQDSNPFFEFMEGFLEGLNVKGDINKILECVKGGEGVLEKVIEALNYLIHIDIRHMEDIIKGITMLVEAVQEIYKIIEPCAQSVEEIKKLIENIISINVIKIVWKLIQNAGQFIYDIQDAVNSFAKGDFRQGGHDVGDILYRLFLAEVTSDPVFDFLKGFFEGLNEKGDVNKIIECIHDLEPIMNEIIQALELISHFKFNDVIEGVKLLVQAVTEMMNAIRPCTEGFEQVKKLMDALMHFNIMKIVTKIMTNPGVFLHDVMECIDSFKKGDFHTCGKDLGDIMYRLFLEESLSFEFDDFIKLIEGFIEGIGHGEKFIDIEKCIEEFPEIYKDVLEAIKCFQEINFKNLDKLVEALIKLFQAMQKVLEAVKPCSKAPSEIEEMIKKIININMQELLQRIIANSIQLFADFTDFARCLKDKDFKKAGKDLGDILYVLVFKDQACTQLTFNPLPTLFPLCSCLYIHVLH